MSVGSAFHVRGLLRAGLSVTLALVSCADDATADEALKPSSPTGSTSADDETADPATGGSTETGFEGTVSFTNDVFPIVVAAGCAAEGCHADATVPTAHWTDFRTPESLHRAVVNVPGGDHCVDGSDVGVDMPTWDMLRVSPYHPEDSLLMKKLLDDRDACTPFFGRMPPPPRSPLDPADIEIIRTWILEGAHQN
jgi:hypothetical protein